MRMGIEIWLELVELAGGTYAAGFYSWLGDTHHFGILFKFSTDYFAGLIRVYFLLIH